MRLTIATALISAFFVAAQDFLIFPGLYSSYLFGRTNQAPSDVEPLTTTSEDGHTVPVWRMRAAENPRKAVALLFHGNAEHLQSFVHMQRWLRSLGITSYAAEYRGYNGRESGWPSESGFYLDGDAAFQLLQREEGVSPSQVLVLGSSIGTGTAAHVAQKHQVGTLVLLSPYSSLTELASELPLFGLLTPFLRYHFPTNDYVSRLTDTCVVLAHGKRDGTIPFHHSEQLKTAYRGTNRFTLIASDDAGHNDLMLRASREVATGVEACLSD